MPFSLVIVSANSFNIFDSYSFVVVADSLMCCDVFIHNILGIVNPKLLYSFNIHTKRTGSLNLFDT